ncbi:MAG: hypothetical protein GJ677_03870 [Rhodobacteraceae bacterium]|nr:hypothetical protein [Paracoccaceae bacterium]
MKLEFTMRFLLVVALLLTSATVSFAGSATDKLSDCLVKQTTGQDRIDLLQWIVLAYAQHPDVNYVVTPHQETQVPSDKKVAALVEQLLTNRCLVQTREAVATDGDIALEAAFSVLGEVAALELMNNPKVNERVLGFAKYLDEQRLSAVLN